MSGPWKLSVFVDKSIKTASFPCSLFDYPTLRTRPHQCLFIWNKYICALWPCFQTKAIKSPNVVAYHARHVVREKTRIPMVLLTQAQYEVHMSDKSLGAETYQLIDVSDGLRPKTITLKCTCGSQRRVGVDIASTENPHLRI